MGRLLRLNYDELKIIVKDFRGRGEDVTLLLTKTRERVNNLRAEWIGEGAAAFFSEMENEILPALARLACALFCAQDVLLRIIKIVEEADVEAAGIFKGDLDGSGAFQVGGLQAGLGGLAGRPHYEQDLTRGTVQMNDGNPGETPPTGDSELRGEYRSVPGGPEIPHPVGPVSVMPGQMPQPSAIPEQIPKPFTMPDPIRNPVGPVSDIPGPLPIPGGEVSGSPVPQPVPNPVMEV